MAKIPATGHSLSRSDAVTDPVSPNAGYNRIIRGGSWGHIARGVRVSDRSDYIPGYRYSGMGFRLVLVP